MRAVHAPAPRRKAMIDSANETRYWLHYVHSEGDRPALDRLVLISWTRWVVSAGGSKRGLRDWRSSSQEEERKRQHQRRPPQAHRREQSKRRDHEIPLGHQRQLKQRRGTGLVE